MVSRPRALPRTIQYSKIGSERQPRLCLGCFGKLRVQAIMHNSILSIKEASDENVSYRHLQGINVT